MIILKAENITKSFSNNRATINVIDNINFYLEEGKITVIVGASGAGKSTLLHILSGLDNPDTGDIIFKNNVIHKLNDSQLSSVRNRNFGFVFQFHQLLPEFTSEENVAIPAMIKGDSKKQALQKAGELLEIVGLGERKNHKPAELSGGEQQRTAVARALINNPEIIFADEPTGNLDSHNCQLMIDLFLKLKRIYNQTFLVVTHNPDLVAIADVVYNMKDGKITIF